MIWLSALLPGTTARMMPSGVSSRSPPCAFSLLWQFTHEAFRMLWTWSKDTSPWTAVATKKQIVARKLHVYVMSLSLPGSENLRIIAAGPAMHFAPISVQAHQSLVEAHYLTLAFVGADRSHFHLDVRGHIDNVIDALQRCPHLEFHDRR